MKSRIIRTAIVCFWLVMMAWLVRFEAFPEHFTHSLDGYKGLLSREILFADSWMKISSNGRPIGYTHTSIDSSESAENEHCVINNRTDLKVKFMGKQQIAGLKASFGLDAGYNLQRFNCSLALGGDSMVISGKRAGERTFDVALDTGDAPYKCKIDLPDNTIVYSPMSAMAMRKLKVGQQVRLQTLDPFSMKKTSCLMKAVRAETLAVGGENYDTTVLETEYRGRKMLTWIDSGGNIVRQDTPLGWTLEKCTAAEAFTAFSESAGGEDIFTTVAGLFMSLQF